MKILFFMPDCPVNIGGRGGNITRTMQMLSFLNDTAEQNEIDFLSIIDWGYWTTDSIKTFRGVFPNINLILRNRKIDKNKYPIKSWICYKIPNFFPNIWKTITGSIDITNSYLKSQIERVVNAKRYDMIIVSYATWSKGIIDKLSYKPYLILDSHDFITAQNRHKISKIGKIFKSEIDVLRKFDEIWTFSVEEKYIFEQFTEAKVIHIPVSFPQKSLDLSKDTYKYDVVYVASSNPHNVRSVNWLLDSVLPKFKEDFKIHVVGPICRVLKDNNNERLVIHGIVDDLKEIYDNARITICPMLSGTGVKIKVLESLSNNLPVVTNTRGVDGLSQKKNNGCLVTDDPEQFALYIEKLLKDDDLYNETRQDAHNFISKNHNVAWEKSFFRNKFSSQKPN